MIASIGSLGSRHVKTVAQTLAFSPSRAVPVGRLVIVWVAWMGDRAYSDPAGYQDDILALEDDAGNVYTQLQSAVYDVSLSIFCTYVDHALTTSSVLTATHGDATLDAKAISAWEFSIADGKRFAYWRDQTHAGEQTSGPMNTQTTVGSLDPSLEYLLIHGLANRRPVSDSYTWDSDYTQIDADGTTGGADDDNVTLRGGWRIASGLTNDTVAVTNNTSNVTRDSWQSILAISETPEDDCGNPFDFPTFPGFDDFNYADVDPLPQPPWDGSDSPGIGPALLRVDGNECARSQTTGAGAGAMFFGTDVDPGDDGEVFGTLAEVGPATLHLFCSGSGPDHTLDSYAAYWKEFLGARPDQLKYGPSANTGGEVTSDGVITWASQAAGFKWGLQLRNSGALVHLWADLGDGWRWRSCIWKTANVRNGGRVGLNMNGDNDVRVDDFGGGTSICFTPQIIRRPPDPGGSREL